MCHRPLVVAVDGFSTLKVVAMTDSEFSEAVDFFAVLCWYWLETETEGNGVAVTAVLVTAAGPVGELVNVEWERGQGSWGRGNGYLGLAALSL